MTGFKKMNEEKDLITMINRIRIEHYNLKESPVRERDVKCKM